MPIVTLAEVQTMLGIGSENYGGRLQGIVDAANAMAEEYMNRWIEKKEYTQTCPGGSKIITLKAYPVESIASITADGVPVDESTWGLDAAHGMVHRGHSWPAIPSGYVVTYTGGFATDKIPAPMKQACALLVLALKNNLENGGQQVFSERLSDYQVSYVRLANAAGIESLSLPAASLMRPYRCRPW